MSSWIKAQMSRTAFYAGSFDPVTLGHLDLIVRALRLFDRLVIGVGVHHGKTPLFAADERIAMLKSEIGAFGLTTANVEVVPFNTLAVDAAIQHGAVALLRGLRDATDFDYEMQMAGMNGAIRPALETVFLPASSGHRHIAATFVRQIALMGGDIGRFVPPQVAQAIKHKLASPTN
jgi:pantetheine-phosphate adenylyltransferase